MHFALYCFAHLLFREWGRLIERGGYFFMGGLIRKEGLQERHGGLIELSNTHIKKHFIVRSLSKTSQRL